MPSNDFRQGGSLLYLAIADGLAEEALDVLIEGGYDVNLRHTDFETPLHLAIRLGRIALAGKLLDANTDTYVLG